MKRMPSLIVLTISTLAGTSSALAQVSPPPVIIPTQRPPVNPGVIAAMAPPKQGTAMQHDCVNVSAIDLKGEQSAFTCHLANGTQTRWSLDILYSGEWLNRPADLVTDLQSDRSAQHVTIMQGVTSLFTIKSLNPSSPARLTVKGKMGPYTPRAEEAILTR